jgi:hypothetical protein
MLMSLTVSLKVIQGQNLCLILTKVTGGSQFRFSYWRVTWGKSKLLK